MPELREAVEGVVAELERRADAAGEQAAAEPNGSNWKGLARSEEQALRAAICLFRKTLDQHPVGAGKLASEEMRHLVATVLIRKGKGYPVDDEGMPHTVYGNPMTAERGHAEKTAGHVLAAIEAALQDPPEDREPNEDEWCCDSCGKIAPADFEGWEQTPEDDAGVSAEWCPDCRLHCPFCNRKASEPQIGCVHRWHPAQHPPEQGEGDPRLGFDLASRAMRDGRTIRAKLSLHRGDVEGTVISVEDDYCLLDISGIGSGDPSRRLYWNELDGFEILPGESEQGGDEDWPDVLYVTQHPPLSVPRTYTGEAENHWNSEYEVRTYVLAQQGEGGLSERDRGELAKLASRIASDIEEDWPHVSEMRGYVRLLRRLANHNQGEGGLTPLQRERVSDICEWMEGRGQGAAEDAAFLRRTLLANTKGEDRHEG